MTQHSYLGAYRTTAAVCSEAASLSAPQDEISNSYQSLVTAGV